MEGNIFDYLEWRGDITFEQSEVNEIDALIFCCLSYINYEGAKNADQKLDAAYEGIKRLPKENQFRGLELMRDDTLKLAETISGFPRFEEIKVGDYIELNSEELGKQFSAMTFLISDKIIFTAFRGTDNSLVGWKENLNMSFTDGTPAQLEATEYVEKIAEKYPERQIYLGGHSKGGNLAVWAAIHSPENIQNRVVNVFNNDGPGFIHDFSDSPEFQKVENKILAFVPESSIIGVLMGASNYRNIESTGISLMQHHPFTWKVVSKNFIYKEEKTFSSKVISGYLNKIIETESPEKLEEFVDQLYESLKENDVRTISDLKKKLWKNSKEIVSQFLEFRGITIGRNKSEWNRDCFLTTKRIGFSKWTPEDTELAKLLWGDPKVTKYICASGIFSPEDIENRLALEISNDEKYGVQYWPIFELETGELIGCCGLRPYLAAEPSESKTPYCEYDSNKHPDRETSDGDSDKPLEGKIYAKEAAEAVMDYAFKTLKAQKLFAGHNPKNIASKKLLNKLGFSYIGDEFYAPTGLYHPSYEKLSK